MAAAVDYRIINYINAFERGRVPVHPLLLPACQPEQPTAKGVFLFIYFNIMGIVKVNFRNIGVNVSKSGRCVFCGKRCVERATFETTGVTMNVLMGRAEKKSDDELRAEMQIKADEWLSDKAVSHNKCWKLNNQKSSQ